MCQHLPYSEIKLTNDILFDDVIYTPDDSSFPKDMHELTICAMSRNYNS